jgi:hypothetical protein
LPKLLKKIGTADFGDVFDSESTAFVAKNTCGPSNAKTFNLPQI